MLTPGAARDLGADLAEAHNSQGLAHHAHAHPLAALPLRKGGGGVWWGGAKWGEAGEAA